MNTGPIDAIARAVLYEGYLLYPYRPSSVKNRQRFNFGVLYPKSYSEVHEGSDPWSLETECLVEGDSRTAIEVRIRFLKIVDRSVWRLANAAPGPGSSQESLFERVAELEVGHAVHASWEEAVECEVRVPRNRLARLTEVPFHWAFAFPGKSESQLLHDSEGRLVGRILRRQEAVLGRVEIEAARAGGIWKLHVRLENPTPVEPREAQQLPRSAALMLSMVSAHVLLGVNDGQFVSLLEPPEKLSALAASCRNLGAWPVLVGSEGDRGAMLASPIILYDYPQVAPESPGDLFDGTEIDEILALRILTMTEDEKNEMRRSDDCARKILERTESLPMESLIKLHGRLRELRPGKEELP